mmetsp:Transcript_43604/g.139087  ORF Transcript_43604/g.139087 Transcript_43604/m.139087 type:complete len:321 (+) Transcript_43604:669-1631(+)
MLGLVLHRHRAVRALHRLDRDNPGPVDNGLEGHGPARALVDVAVLVRQSHAHEARGPRGERGCDLLDFAALGDGGRGVTDPVVHIGLVAERHHQVVQPRRCDGVGSLVVSIAEVMKGARDELCSAPHGEHDVGAAGLETVTSLIAGLDEELRGLARHARLQARAAHLALLEAGVEGCDLHNKPAPVHLVLAEEDVHGVSPRLEQGQRGGVAGAVLGERGRRAAGGAAGGHHLDGHRLEAGHAAARGLFEGLHRHLDALATQSHQALGLYESAILGRHGAVGGGHSGGEGLEGLSVHVHLHLPLALGVHADAGRVGSIAVV